MSLWKKLSIWNKLLMLVRRWRERRNSLSYLPTSCRLVYTRLDASGEKDTFGHEIPDKLTATFSFSQTGFGFGEITICVDKDGQHYIDGERMSNERIKYLLGVLVDSAIMDSDRDPLRHERYDIATGRQCGSCPTRK